MAHDDVVKNIQDERRVTSRESLHSGIEQMMENARRRPEKSGMAAERLCPKCESRWWEEKFALARDANRAGRASKFNENRFAFYECVCCGYIELPDVAYQSSRNLRFYYQDFVGAIGQKMKRQNAIARKATPQKDVVTKATGGRKPK